MRYSARVSHPQMIRHTVRLELNLEVVISERPGMLGPTARTVHSSMEMRAHRGDHRIGEISRPGRFLGLESQVPDAAQLWLREAVAQAYEQLVEEARGRFEAQGATPMGGKCEANLFGPESET